MPHNNRGQNVPQSLPQSAQQTAGHPPHHQPTPRRKHIDWAARTIRIEIFIVLVGSALLLAAVSFYLAFNGGLDNELKHVAKDKYQAVFINTAPGGNTGYNGHLYFGRITKLNNDYLVLNNVYFLTEQQTQANQPSSPQLTKLGCQQLHAPFDHMVINRSQVAFWENVRDDGKVVQAIKDYEKQNPNGPDCSQQTQPTAAPPAPAAPPPAPTPPSTNR